MANPGLFLVLFSFYLKTFFTEKTVDFSGIRTCIVRTVNTLTTWPSPRPYNTFKRFFGHLFSGLRNLSEMGSSKGEHPACNMAFTERGKGAERRVVVTYQRAEGRQRRRWLHCAALSGRKLDVVIACYSSNRKTAVRWPPVNPIAVVRRRNQIRVKECRQLMTLISSKFE